MRSRVTQVAVVATVVAVLLFGIPLAVATGRLVRADEEHELERVALLAAASVDPGLGRAGDPLELPPVERGGSVAVYGTDGARAAGTGPDTADATVRAALAGRVPDAAESAGALVVAVPVRSGERLVGAVRAATPIAAVTTRTSWVWAAMALLAGLAVAAATGVARFAARRLARPLEELARVARAHGEGDLTATVSRSGIAELDTVAESVEGSAARLTALLNRERAFAEDASHQLRTPLTRARWALEAALADPEADLREAARGAVSAAAALEASVTELLALARETAVRAEVDVAAIVAESRDRWHGTFAADGRALSLRVEGPAAAAVAPAAVRHVLDVLLDNAHRHGAGRVVVTVRPAAGGSAETGALALEVSDEGQINGDSATMLSRRGATGDHSIGLALARRLAEDEGGRLVLTSANPTTFMVLLPGAS